MANEIHSLKIGNTEYPIYSEGLKIDDQVSGSAFLVVDGPNNRKVGTSTAIVGDGTSLSLASDTINIGNGWEGHAPTVIIGDNAGMLYIGGGSTNPVTIHIGAGNDGEAPSNIKMGTPGGSIEIGIDADNIVLGQNTDSIDIGENSDITIGEAGTVNIGHYGSTIDVGEVADEVNIGYMSYGVNVGNQCEGNVVIGDGSVWTSEDEDGNEIVEKATSTFIGENNYETNIGNNSNITTIGSNNDLTNIGNNSNTIVFGAASNSLNIGPSCNSLIIGESCNELNIGSTTTSDILITTGSDDADAAIQFYDDQSGGTYGPTQRIMIKSVEDKNSGSDIYSSLLINGANTMLKSSYNDNHISSIDMGDEYIVISNEHPNPNDETGKRISSIELGDKTSDYGGINLTASQCGINISTQYFDDDLSSETGDFGDINIHSSDGKINLNSNSSTNITAEGDLNLITNYGDVDITSKNYNINISTLGNIDGNAGFITIDAESGVAIEASDNIDLKALGKVNILANTEISLETSNHDIEIIANDNKIYLNKEDEGINILSDDYTNVAAYNIHIGGDYKYSTNTHGVYIGHNASDVDISGTYISIGNAGQSEITSDIHIESPNIYISGCTQVFPELSTNLEMNTGFSVIREDNLDVGVVFCAPTIAGKMIGKMIILPKGAYNSITNAVSLGNTSKRFSELFVVSGKATNGFTTDSDERLKDFGDNIEVDLDALATLRKSYYRWNETSGFENEKDRMLGMSAQEVQKIYPELVDADENGMFSMSYDRLSVVALAAIDKLHETNKELKAENDELKERLTRLENLVNEKLSTI